MYHGLSIAAARESARMCAFIGMSLIGISFFGNTFRTPIVAGVVGAALRLSWALSAFTRWLLLPTCSRQLRLYPKHGQCPKTRGVRLHRWAARSVFAIFPPLAMLAILGLYSLVLLYFGLGPMMKTPDDKKDGLLHYHYRRLAS